MGSLSMLPKGTLAFLIIAGGLLFIVMSKPPHTVCDSQIEVINKSQQKFLFKDTSGTVAKSSRYSRLREHCFNTNNPGGCYELFQELKTMVFDLKSLSSECSAQLGDVSEYKNALWDSADLLARLAWGSSVPASTTVKFGWLEVSDITLFCRIKERIVGMYGEDSWDSFRSKKMAELPGAKDLNDKDRWDLSLFSENCARYP